LFFKDSKAQIAGTCPAASCTLGAPHCLRLALADAKQCAGQFFDMSFSFNHWYFFQHICFHFLSHFSVICGVEGQMIQQTIDNNFCMLGGGISILRF